MFQCLDNGTLKVYCQCTALCISPNSKTSIYVDLNNINKMIDEKKTKPTRQFILDRPDDLSLKLHTLTENQNNLLRIE